MALTKKAVDGQSYSEIQQMVDIGSSGILKAKDKAEVRLRSSTLPYLILKCNGALFRWTNGRKNLRNFYGRGISDLSSRMSRRDRF